MDIILEDNNNEEPKYIVSFDPVKDDKAGVSVSTFKVKDGVVEHINPHNFSVEKILDTIRECFEDEVIERERRKAINYIGPSFMDFYNYGRPVQAMGIIPIDPKLHFGPDTGILGPLADHKINVLIMDSDWLISTSLSMMAFKGFDQRRKLAKRRCKVSQYTISCKEHSFYKRYKLI